MARLSSRTQGRIAYSRRQWRQAFDHLSAADSESVLSPADLVQLGDAAYLIGDESEAIAVWTRAHTGFVEQADTLRASRVAFWLSL